MKKKLKSASPLRAATCSPSSDADEMKVVLSRDKTGKLGILNAPPIFLCTRESLEDMVTRHNDLLAERDALKVAGVEIIETARRSMPRKHGTIERNAKLFIPENANVDLPDTAAQDSASKSNSPAVSG